jgi:hypothetical protein
MCYTKYLYMFRAIICSSSGGQNCISTVSGIVILMSGRVLHRLRADIYYRIKKLCIKLVIKTSLHRTLFYQKFLSNYFIGHVSTGMQVVSTKGLLVCVLCVYVCVCVLECVSVRARDCLLALSLAALMYDLCRFSSKKRNTLDELTARMRVPMDILYNPVGS